MSIFNIQKQGEELYRFLFKTKRGITPKVNPDVCCLYPLTEMRRVLGD